MKKEVREAIENARKFGVKKELEALFSHAPNGAEYFPQLMLHYDETTNIFNNDKVSYTGEEFANELFMFAQIRGLHRVVQKSRDMLRILPDYRTSQEFGRQAVQSPRAYVL